MVLCAFAAPALATQSSEPILVRVNSFDQNTRVYNMSCILPLTAGPDRTWSIRPDVSAAAIEYHTTTNSSLVTIDQNVMYHISCGAMNTTGYIMTDFHIDRRTALPNDKPYITVDQTEGRTLRARCNIPANVTQYSLNWVINSHGGTQQLPQFNNQLEIVHTVPYAAQWEITCNVWDIPRSQYSRGGLSIEFFNNGPAYIPTVDGCIPGDACPYVTSPARPLAWVGAWPHNSTNTTPPVTQNVTIASSTPSGVAVSVAEPQSHVFSIALNNPSSLPVTITWRKDGVNQTGAFNQLSYQFIGGYSTAGVYEILVTVHSPQNIVSKLWTITVADTPQNQTNTTCYATLQSLPAACTGGVITSDTFTGGRAITCTQGGNSLSITAWPKPDNTFEMYRQSSSGIAPKICLGTTCIQNNGFAKSTTFPICVNGTTNSTNSTPPNGTGNQTNTTVPFPYNNCSSISLLGNTAQFRTSADQLEIGENLGNVRDVFTSYELPTLNEGTVSTPLGTTSYQQYLRFLDGGDIAQSSVFLTTNLSGSFGDYLVIPSEPQFMEWEVQFPQGLASRLSTGELYDLRDRQILIMNKTFTIATAHINPGFDIMFLRNAINGSLQEGQTQSYSVGIRNIPMTLVFVNESGAVKFMSDGEVSPYLSPGTAYSFANGASVFVKNVTVTALGGSSQFAVSDMLLTFIDPTPTGYNDFDGTAKMNGQTLNRTKVTVTTSTYANGTVEVSSIKYAIVADPKFGSTIYIPRGFGVRDYVKNPAVFISEDLDVKYEGLSMNASGNRTLPQVFVTFTPFTRTCNPLPTPLPQNLTARLLHAQWFPQGRNTILVCNATGFTPTSYDFVFGDGAQNLNYNQNNVWHTYPAAGAYTASCVARTATQSVTAVLPVVLS